MMNANPTSRPIFVSRVMCASIRLNHEVTKITKRFPYFTNRPPERTDEQVQASLRARFVPSWLILLNHAELRRARARVAGGFCVGGGEGLFGDQLDLPGLLRRPKRLLHQSIFRRVEADHPEATAAHQVA